MEKKSISWGSILLTAGAFISYTVGSGFASGNEVLQFYGSWGFPGAIFAMLGGITTAVLYCVCLFWIGRQVDLDKPSDLYFFFGGKALGWFFQIFVYVFILGCYMLMFSGAGNLLQQQFGIPKWIGAVVLGVISLVVILGGLKTIENVLGCAGIVILGYAFIFSIVSLLNPGSGIAQSASITAAVENGQVWQANFFGMFPLSLIPGLSALNGPAVEGGLYATMCLVSGFPFYFMLGKRSKSGKEAVISGCVTAVAFYACVGLTLLIMLLNGGSLINPATNKMFEFPLVAAINSLWPSGSWTYVVIIFIGIFTTTTGYLWVINDLLFPGSEKLTGKGRTLIIILLLMGIALGGIIPFSALINIMFPLSGLVGLIIVVSVIVKVIEAKKQIK